MEHNTLTGKTALVTGAARRIGASICTRLHEAGMNLVLHYRNSRHDAQELQELLNRARPDSAAIFSADLNNHTDIARLAEQATQRWGRLDLLVNNASVFYPTPISSTGEAQWDELLGSNLKAPFFLTQATLPCLLQTRGCIVNLADIYGQRPLPQHALYCAAKAGLIMLTKALARDLAPEVRVNAVAPGAILWPEKDGENETQSELLARVPLQRKGDPDDIAKAVLYLAKDATYMTGQILNLDGGRTLFI